MKSSFPYRVALITPADMLTQAEDLFKDLGWGDAAFSVPLSQSGDDIISHYGLSIACRQSDVDWLSGKLGNLPERVDQTKLKTIVAALHLDIAPSGYSPVVQFQQLCAATGVTRVEVEEVE